MVKKAVSVSALFLSWITLAAANPTLILDEENLPPEFEARYEVHKNGIYIGEMQVRLKKIGEELIYESVTDIAGIAVLLLGRQVTHHAVLKRIGKSYRVSEFKHEVRGGSKNRNEHYIFDWNNNRANVQYRDRSAVLNISPYTFDSFSVQLLLMREPKDENAENRFPVIGRGRLKEYVYRLATREHLETKLGKLMANKYVRQKNNDKNTTHFGWYAESLHYIPVKLGKIENGKVVLSIQITAVTWI